MTERIPTFNFDPTHEDDIIITIGRVEAKASYHEGQPSEDYILVDEARRIFGVFDGAGGGGGRPDMASFSAARAVRESLVEAGNPSTPAELKMSMKRAFAEARQSVLEHAEGGFTVGTPIKVTKIDGTTMVGVAHAGDTGLFSYDGKEIKALTTEQCHGRFVTNCLGREEYNGEADEYKVFKIDGRIRLMICSDGITGDEAYQRLTPEEMLDAFSQETPQEAAERFKEYSKKDDDKSVLVLDIS